MSTTGKQSYQSGAFEVRQSVHDEDGRQWIEMELIVTSGPIRVPVRGGQLREAELRCEKLCLVQIAAEVDQASQPEDD